MRETLNTKTPPTSVFPQPFLPTILANCRAVEPLPQGRPAKESAARRNPSSMWWWSTWNLPVSPAGGKNLRPFRLTMENPWTIRERCMNMSKVHGKLMENDGTSTKNGDVPLPYYVASKGNLLKLVGPVGWDTSDTSARTFSTWTRHFSMNLAFLLDRWPFFIEIGHGWDWLGESSKLSRIFEISPSKPGGCKSSLPNHGFGESTAQMARLSGPDCEMLEDHHPPIACWK